MNHELNPDLIMSAEKSAKLLEDWSRELNDMNPKFETGHYSALGSHYKQISNKEEREDLVSKMIVAMKGIQGEQKDHLLNLQICNLFRADMAMGMDVAMGMGMDMDTLMNGMMH